ncbi:MAG: lysophospholipid acyltransferase family protein [Verrucomicrobiota bacterium]
MLVKPRIPAVEGSLKLTLQALMAAYFRRIYLSGYEGFSQELSTQAKAGPVIFYGNHPSWWDGFLDYILARHYGLCPWIMMEQVNLRRYPLFQYAGVFGVDNTTSRGKAVSLLHAQRLLEQGPGNTLIIYPHGRLVPAYEPWPEFLPGVGHLLKRVPGLLAFPVHRRLHIRDHARPEAWLEVGPPLSEGATNDDLESGLLQAADAQRDKLLGDANWLVLRSGSNFK